MELRKQYPRLIEELSEQAHKFYAMRYQMSNGGNLSARIPNTDYMLVKGTDVDFSGVCLETLVVTSFEGELIEGTCNPSKEALLHGALYRALPKLGAIMHCHSPWATAWADKHEQLGFSTYHSALKLNGFCPVFDSKSYIVPPEYFRVILAAFEEHPKMNAFLLRKHGQVALGKDIHAAALLAELIEETAHIALASNLG